MLWCHLIVTRMIYHSNRRISIFSLIYLVIKTFSFWKLKEVRICRCRILVLSHKTLILSKQRRGMWYWLTLKSTMLISTLVQHATHWINQMEVAWLRKKLRPKMKRHIILCLFPWLSLTNSQISRIRKLIRSWWSKW